MNDSRITRRQLFAAAAAVASALSIGTPTSHAIRLQPIVPPALAEPLPDSQEEAPKAGSLGGATVLWCERLASYERERLREWLAVGASQSGPRQRPWRTSTDDQGNLLVTGQDRSAPILARGLGMIASRQVLGREISFIVEPLTAEDLASA